MPWHWPISWSVRYGWLIADMPKTRQIWDTETGLAGPMRADWAELQCKQTTAIPHVFVLTAGVPGTATRAITSMKVVKRAIPRATWRRFFACWGGESNKNDSIASKGSGRVQILEFFVSFADLMVFFWSFFSKEDGLKGSREFNNDWRSSYPVSYEFMGDWKDRTQQLLIDFLLRKSISFYRACTYYGCLWYRLQSPYVVRLSFVWPWDKNKAQKNDWLALVLVERFAKLKNSLGVRQSIYDWPPLAWAAYSYHFTTNGRASLRSAI